MFFGHFYTLCILGEQTNLFSVIEAKEHIINIIKMCVNIIKTKIHSKNTKRVQIVWIVPFIRMKYKGYQQALYCCRYSIKGVLIKKIIQSILT